MIDVISVSKDFGRTKALKRVSLEAGKGEVTALLGLNGAGKTTLMKCIMGILNFEGKIRASGHDVKREGKIVRGMMGYVPQTPNLYEEMSVGEVSLFFARLKGVDVEKSGPLLRMFGLEDQKRKRVGSLSGGMRQRLSLAIALLADPPILLLDEPTANLDAKGRADLLQLIKRRKEAGGTIIISSHRIEETEELADRVVILDQGKAVLKGSTGDLIRGLRRRTRLHVELSSAPTNGLMMRMKERGFHEISITDRSLRIEADTLSKMAALRSLEELGTGVKDFRVEEPSLEQIILELTERKSE